MRNVVTINESETSAKKQKTPLCKVAFRVCVAIVLFAFALCLFSVGDAESKTVYNELGAVLGIDTNSTASDLAYAWSNPSGGSGDKYVSPITPNQMQGQQTCTTMVPGRHTGSWNWGCSGGYCTEGGIVAETKDAVKACMIFYVDLYLDDAMRSAIANGQVTKCSVAMDITDSGGAYWREVGHFYGTFFLCSSTTGEQSGEINDMGDVLKSSVKQFDNKCGGGRVSKSSGNLEIALTKETVKIRYGAYFKLEKDKTGFQADVYVRAPVISTPFTTDQYKASTITVNKDGNGSVESSAFGNGIQAGTKYTAAYTRATTFDGTVVGDITAKADPGYYFSGWEISSGNIYYRESNTWKTYEKYHPTLKLPGGYAIKGNLVVKATFKKIKIKDIVGGNELSTNENKVYTYKQQLKGDGSLDLDGSGKPKGLKQGPVIDGNSIKVGDTTFFAKGGKVTTSGFILDNQSRAYRDKTTGNSTYTSTEAPTEQGQYVYEIGIFATQGSQVVLGYISVEFTISKEPLSSSGYTVTTDLGSYTYTGSAHKPVPNFVDVKRNSDNRPFRLVLDKDYSAKDLSYDANINAGNATLTLAPNATANFSGQISQGYEIKKRNLSETTVDPIMASEIQERYNVYYNGYPQRPEVLVVRVSIDALGSNGPMFILYASKLPTNGSFTSRGYEEKPIGSGVVITEFSILNRDKPGANGVYDYVNAFRNNVNVTTDDSKASFTISIDSGNFAGTIDVEFDIAPLDLSNKKEKYNTATEYVYSGYTVLDQEGTLVYNGAQQAMSFDYVIVEVSGLEVYKYNPNTVGLYDYYSNTKVKFVVKRNGAGSVSVQNDQIDTGATYTILENGYKNNKDVSYDDKGNVIKSAIATIGIDEYCNVTGSIQTKFAITPKDLKTARARFLNAISEVYTGDAVTPNAKVRVMAKPAGTAEVTLAEGRDYTVEFSDNVNATTSAKIIVTGKGNYTGTIDNFTDIETTGGQFYITAIDATRAKIDRIYDAYGNDFEYALGAKVNPTPQTIIVTVGSRRYVLELGKDYSVVEGSGANINVGSYIEDIDNEAANYIKVMFAGCDPKGVDKGQVNGYGTSGDFYTSVARAVFFRIAPRDISKVATEAGSEFFANWGDIARESVTYNGKALVDLEIRANKADKNSNSVYIKDSYNGGEVTKILRYGTNAAESGVDYILSGYGENVNAGPTAGQITFAGVNNYTGSLTINFRIYERDLTDNVSIAVRHGESDSATYSSQKNGYLFTGSLIKPSVNSVTDSGLKSSVNAIALVENKDFYVEYGSSEGDNKNIFVTSGGVINIRGKGNYTGTYVCAFNIVPISQSVELVDPGTINATALKEETIATRLAGGVFYADYEIASASNSRVRLEATTTATYPSARRVTFVIRQLNGGVSSLATIEYESCEIVEGVSKTVAYLVIKENSYGIIRVYAEQYDSALANGAIRAKDGKVGEEDYYHLGNYENYSYNANTDTEYAIFSKRSDSTVSTLADEIVKTYGNGDFTVNPGLASRRINASFGYNCSVADDSILRLIVDSGDARVFRVIGAGKTTVTFSHNGFVDYTDDAKAFSAFEKAITVTVNKRNLVISFEALEVEYGHNLASEPVFNFTFTTNTNGAVYSAQDSYTGLNYGVRSDNCDDIVKNLRVNYSYDLHKNVKIEEGIITSYELSVVPVQVEDRGALYDNYEITYGSGTLTVNKKELEVNVTNGKLPNQIVRNYGSNNPINYKINYFGFAYGEGESVLALDKEFIPPTVNYGDIGITTEAGSYTAKLEGGKVNNYTFKSVDVTVIIQRAEVTITNSEPTVVVYTGDGVPFNDENISISGVNVEGCVEPVPGSSIKYEYYFAGKPLSGALPTGAGEYTVKVTFNPAENDNNYTKTVKEFVGALVINKAEPIIKYLTRKYEYTGEALKPDQVSATIERTPNGSIPKKATATYWFAKSGDTSIPDGCENDGSYPEYFGQERPAETGTYDVIVVYKANAGDNYRDCIKRFNNAIEIISGLARITIKKSTKEAVYSGSGVQLSLYSDFEDITFRDKANNTEIILSKGNAKILYYIKDEFVDTAPTEVGEYNVKVIYTPVGDEVGKVALTETLFVNAIRITPYDLYENNKITLTPTGDDVTADGCYSYVYNGEGQGVRDEDINISGLGEDATNPTGIAKVTYEKDGMSYAIPVNVGYYDVLVTYDSQSMDNYVATGVVRFESKVRIEATDINIPTDIGTVTYDYNGTGFGMTVTYSGIVVSGQAEQPNGRLEYEYCLSGSEDWSEELPINAGNYDVRVTYRAVSGDNYNDGFNATYESAIVIVCVKPLISITNARFNFGDSHISAAYTVKGAQYDVNGPLSEVEYGNAELVIQYGLRQISGENNYYYEWNTEPPTVSGKYSVKITFTPSDQSNYLTATATQYDCLVIDNVAPSLFVENKVVTYDGSRHRIGDAKVFVGYDEYHPYGSEDSGLSYYGFVSYEYRLVGASVWTSTAPSSAGTYDVRVKYNENPKKDIFTSTSQVINGALKIEKLVITISPIYGQGKVYNGKEANGSGLAYAYSYVDSNGNVEYVYSMVADRTTGDLIDVSRATYVAKNGDVYTVWMGTESTYTAWRDYVQVAIEYVEAQFTVDGEQIPVDYKDLEQTGTTTIVHNDKGYVIDTDNGYARRRTADKNEVNEVNGYFFSVVDKYGKVNVVSIDEKKIDSASHKGTVTSDGVPYSINLNALTATSNGETFRIYTFAWKVEVKRGDNDKHSYLLDPARIARTIEDGTIAYYKTSDGTCLRINLDDMTAEEAYDIVVGKARFTCGGKTYEFNPESIDSEYIHNGYIGKVGAQAKDGTKIDVNVSVRARTANVPLAYKVVKNESGRYYIYIIGETIEFSFSELKPIEIADGQRVKNLYLLETDVETFYIELDGDEGIARLRENMATFDTSANTFTRVGSAFAIEIGEEGKKEFTYNLMHRVKVDGAFVYVNSDIVKLFDASYITQSPDLISGNDWVGTMSLNAKDFGKYDIGIGTLKASSNYEVVFVNGGMTYYVDKARLKVEFSHDTDTDVYNGREKVIDYEIYGIIEGDSVGSTAEYEGDRRNVTENGYYIMVRITSPNYYIVGEKSETYKVLPAEMEEIEFVPQENVVYDGKSHYLQLNDIPTGAKVTYNGSEEAPSFKEPGTYTVTAIVSKENYKPQSIDMVLTINKSKYTVVPNPVTETLKYGDPLPTLTANTDLGKVVLDAGQILDPDVTTYSWTFIPDNSNFYFYYEGNAEDGNVIKGTIELNVQKATAEIVINENLVQTVSNPKALLAYINGMSQEEYDNITIEYIGADSTKYTQMPKSAGRYTVVIIYGGNDKYAETVYTTTLTIKDENKFDWMIYVGVVLLTLGLASTVFFLFRRRTIKK